MRIATRSRITDGGRPFLFLKGFLRKPKEVGSVIPSSRYLIRQVLDRGCVGRAQVIVELGPGTGVLTREILRRMPTSARLVAVEISPLFVRVLRRSLPDPRLSVFQGSSSDLERALEKVGVERADVVISGVPFSMMGRAEGYRTLQAAKRILGPGGRLVAYQFRNHVQRLAEPLFGPAETHRGLWNLPPMRIYVWRADGWDS